MQNYHIIIAKYMLATNHRPSRIKLISARYGDSKTIPYQSDSTQDDAISYLKSLGFEVVGKAWNETTNDNYIITDTWKPIN